MKRLSINIGFITNSSSVIHAFDQELLEDEDVKAFMIAYEIQDGFIGKNLWNRSQCGSVILTEEQRQEAIANLNDEEYGNPNIPEPVVVIYGDEYNTLAREVCDLLSNAAKKLGKGDMGQNDFN